LENDVLEPGDKTVFEIAKKSLASNDTWAWWLEIDKGWYWENWEDIYDKPLIIKPGKGILVYIVGTVSSKTYKVMKKLVTLK
jgi:hypothetical protein